MLDNKNVISVVSYLNILPITFHININKYIIKRAIPSKLLERFNDINTEISILSLYDVLTNKDILILDNLSISTYSKTHSVFLFYNKDIKSIRNIALDISSVTSNKLLQLLLIEYYNNNKVVYNKFDSKFIIDNKDKYDGYVLIGDNAIEHAKSNSNYIDISYIWTLYTGLPFVFAVFCSKSKFINIKNDILKSKEYGLNNIDLIVSSIKDPSINKDFLFKYYTEYINYDLTDKHKQAISLFKDKLIKNNLLDFNSNYKYY